jgi:hypothetical protein
MRSEGRLNPRLIPSVPRPREGDARDLARHPIDAPLTQADVEAGLLGPSGPWPCHGSLGTRCKPPGCPWHLFPSVPRPKGGDARDLARDTRQTHRKTRRLSRKPYQIYSVRLG